MSSTVSTTSSNCENCDCCRSYALDDKYSSYHYQGRPRGSSRYIPFYTTLGHPLIYYADIQRPLNRRQRDQPRKETQNCFMKAFNWYTQERPAKTDNAPERRPGFANWLDNKYVEYLRESRQNQTYQLTVQETTTIEPCAPCPSQNEPCSTKRFARMRSPWRKRRRPCKDSGDVSEKCTNQSCEFILQPKDLTRAASDCYPTPTSGNIKSSASLVVSSNAQGTIRCPRRSQSLSSVCREKSGPKHIDTIPCIVQEGLKTPEPTKPRSKHEKIQEMPLKSPKVKHASCQCPEEPVIPVNVETQYESMGFKKTSNSDALGPCFCIRDKEYKPPKEIQDTKHTTVSECRYLTSSQDMQELKQGIPCECRLVDHSRDIQEIKQVTLSKSRNATPIIPSRDIQEVNQENLSGCRNVPLPPVALSPHNQQTLCECHYGPPSRDVQEINQVFGPKTIRRQSFTTVAVKDTETISECDGKEVATVCQSTRSFTYLATEGVQTSDHAICFENPYPLFVRIVCTDRLNSDQWY